MRAECGRLVSMSRAAWGVVILFPSVVCVGVPAGHGVGPDPAGSCSGSAGCQMVGETPLGACAEGGALLRCVDQRGSGGIGRLAEGHAAVGELLRLHALTSAGAAPRTLPALLTEGRGGHPVVDTAVGDRHEYSLRMRFN